MSSEQEFAWACGLFEGEGSITHKKSKGRVLRVLSLGSTDEDVVRRFHKVVGVGKVRGPYRSNGPRSLPTHKPIWHWTCGRWVDGAPLLERMMPFLGDRRREKAMDYLAHPPKRIQMGTHCTKGHELTEDNVYRPPGEPAIRACIACRRLLRGHKGPRKPRREGPCDNCGQHAPKLIKERCIACYSYLKRVGKDRPERLYAAVSTTPRTR